MSNSSDVPSIKVWGWTLSVFVLSDLHRLRPRGSWQVSHG